MVYVYDFCDNTQCMSQLNTSHIFQTVHMLVCRRNARCLDALQGHGDGWKEWSTGWRVEHELCCSSTFFIRELAEAAKSKAHYSKPSGREHRGWQWDFQIWL